MYTQNIRPVLGMLICFLFYLSLFLPFFSLWAEKWKQFAGAIPKVLPGNLSFIIAVIFHPRPPRWVKTVSGPCGGADMLMCHGQQPINTGVPVLLVRRWAAPVAMQGSMGLATRPPVSTEPWDICGPCWKGSSAKVSILGETPPPLCMETHAVCRATWSLL